MHLIARPEDEVGRSDWFLTRTFREVLGEAPAHAFLGASFSRDE